MRIMQLIEKETELEGKILRPSSEGSPHQQKRKDGVKLMGEALRY
jgi:hypothetical protein